MTSAPSRRRLKTVEDVADELHMSTRNVRRLIDRGDLHIHRLGRLIRIDEEDLKSYLACNRI